MPSIKVKSSTGKTEFKYTISTPTSPNAKSIDKSLPTLLFIHAVYIPRNVYHLQFGDPRLRRFNLVSFDLRTHGETTGDKVPPGYGQKEAAEDVAKLIDALKLPACHVIGMSLGTIIALQLAVSYPDKVESLFLISPLGLEEPPEIAAGRTEIHDYWVEGFQDNKIDEMELLDAIYGSLQLAFSNKTSSLISALVQVLYPTAKKIWGPKDFDAYTTSTLDFFTQRKGYSRQELSKIKAPVKLIHGLDDVAYPIEYTMEQEKLMKDAGLDVTFTTIAHAPHFIVVDYGLEVNGVLHDYVMKYAKGSVPPAPSDAVSPWDAQLRKAGWVPGDMSDDDD
ncbi:alpha beta hydrolase fold protein [Moniliophthora roreri MCA 2997]|uniref:Alpha beta hydrolase fold protein n=2 Tax=Moniliophthora roreri TaxID=221103 RepID=V2XGE0_MONRO|nr:alpha beta hydrolase fold protein [Moniliophthora roreri MCA 2997]KAI3619387.1 alpha beta hydrolase fold protein [Moniliophthora roreri]